MLTQAVCAFAWWPTAEWAGAVNGKRPNWLAILALWIHLLYMPFFDLWCACLALQADRMLEQRALLAATIEPLEAEIEKSQLLLAGVLEQGRQLGGQDWLCLSCQGDIKISMIEGFHSFQRHSRDWRDRRDYTSVACKNNCLHFIPKDNKMSVRTHNWKSRMPMIPCHTVCQTPALVECS